MKKKFNFFIFNLLDWEQIKAGTFILVNINFYVTVI